MMVPMLRFFFLVVCLAVSPLLGAQDWASMIDQVGPRVAKVELKLDGNVQSSGSAFLISSDGRVLTSAHVVTEAQFDKKVTIQLTFTQSSGTKVFPAQIELISDELDLAILRIAGSSFQPFALSEVPQARLMSEVLVLGYPLGLNFKATPGFVQAIQDVPQLGPMLDLSASVDPGNSGGPVVGKDGKVVGIVTSKIVGANFNLALPIRNAIEFLSMADHPVTFQVKTTPSGARVFLNGLFKGNSPLTLQLLAQKAELSVEQEGFEVLKKSVQVEQGKVADQELVLQPVVSQTTKVHFQVQPAGAQIWVNNSLIGKAPLDWETDKGIRLRLRIEAPGYTTLNTAVTLTEEKEQTITLELKKGWF